MVEEIVERSKLDELIRRSRIALIAFTKPNSDAWNYAKRLLSKLESKAGYLMNIAIADASLENISSREPVIRMYLDSKLVFEQQGVFWKHDLDYEALRRGIKSVLKKHSIKTLF